MLLLKTQKELTQKTLLLKKCQLIRFDFGALLHNR